MTREDFAASLRDERHDTIRCQECGERRDRSEVHDGVCEWCRGDVDGDA